ncbi:hypothetical protein CWE09_11810 [Aliidiomarina minuta]|uniref:Tetrapyrrole biosynthesis uroporphyrinogen III synthase domain-containing protein n=1 Tax=Aliidiomarina minuta TaxID=880057 RepID=A0A432W3A6_9GAMM|nr:uroporphyrinogen-III C-methyltransferase [Aliidiomarina minuta]RUO23833.1 hypothetical protein CWE09_11810 [Aliidiomarina minuta]
MTNGVLLIRQHDQANPLEKALAERDQPVFRQAVIESEMIQLPQKELSELTEQSWDGIIVVSPAAVEFFHQQLQKHDFKWPQGNYYSVGSGTAERLVTHTHQPVTYPAPNHTGEDLLKLPDLHQIKGQDWLFVTGADGRPLIAETLSERGAKLTSIEVYKRIPLHPDLSENSRLWQEQVATIVVTSKEQLELFWQDLPDSAKNWAQNCNWVISSERLQKAVTDLGINKQRLIVAQNATTDALLKAIPTQSEKVMSKPTEQKSPATKQRKTKKTSWLTSFIILLLLLSVATLGVGGYWLWLQQQEIKRTSVEQMEELNQRLVQTTRAQEELEQSLFDDIESQMNQRFDALREQRNAEAAEAREEAARERQAMFNELESNREEIEQIKSHLDTANLRLSQDLYVIEARDLVVAAGRKLWFDYDRNGAVQLLQHAKRVLEQSRQSHLIPIRQQLENDIELLNGLPEVDVEGLALRLSALRQQVRELPPQREQLESKPLNNGNGNGNDEVSSSFADWRSNLNAAWQSFSEDFIRVQRTEEMPEMQLGAEQRSLLKTQLDLQLQIAQQALLQRQAVNFEQAMDQAIDWINSYYDTESTQVRHVLDALTQLREQNIEPEFPTRLLSEAMLNDAVDELLGESD